MLLVEFGSRALHLSSHPIHPMHKMRRQHRRIINTDASSTQTHRQHSINTDASSTQTHRQRDRGWNAHSYGTMPMAREDGRIHMGGCTWEGACVYIACGPPLSSSHLLIPPKHQRPTCPLGSLRLIVPGRGPGSGTGSGQGQGQGQGQHRVRVRVGSR